MGRVGVLVDSAPEIYPVNHVVDRQTIVFRTDTGSKLGGLDRSSSPCVGKRIQAPVRLASDADSSAIRAHDLRNGALGMAQAAGAPGRASSMRQGLPYAGSVVGVWAALAPYALLGPDLNAQGSREVVDHVVPGVLMIALSVATLARHRRGATGGTFGLLAGFGVLLAGLWMTATHLPLVTDAREGAVSDSVAAWHIVPGLVVMALGLVWAAAHWSSAAAGPVA